MAATCGSADDRTPLSGGFSILPRPDAPAGDDVRRHLVAFEDWTTRGWTLSSPSGAAGTAGLKPSRAPLTCTSTTVRPPARPDFSFQALGLLGDHYLGRSTVAEIPG